MLRFRVESWVWYGIATAITLARMYVRRLCLGSIQNQLADGILHPTEQRAYYISALRSVSNWTTS